jgi:hypothetical protein
LIKVVKTWNSPAEWTPRRLIAATTKIAQTASGTTHAGPARPPRVAVAAPPNATAIPAVLVKTETQYIHMIK